MLSWQFGESDQSYGTTGPDCRQTGVDMVSWQCYASAGQVYDTRSPTEFAEAVVLASPCVGELEVAKISNRHSHVFVGVH
jgi:hypothetical protein